MIKDVLKLLSIKDAARYVKEVDKIAVVAFESGLDPIVLKRLEALRDIQE